MFIYSMWLKNVGPSQNFCNISALTSLQEHYVTKAVKKER